MSDAAWRVLGAVGVLPCGWLLWALELALWQQALVALLALDSLLLALLGWRYIEWFLGLFGSETDS
ncbi:MAG: hypothetical protein QF366_01255 [Candidatus Poseidoniia archaeon]|jgi:hypothetical protein|nr:hypothetical protein [Candidatus Poseidoniia archaeon]MDP6659237.1 hypothetical protein [Candidatus Poseidoniia archaeon]MDP6846260.1 hypothetical protein [Candidatus Poseidoniia archaeon]MDP7007835.1 hypothetical protein [Candidatus Poseidoniia archaeon]|tara:strand:- start:306 stop:503 length:198 start_codon:yes stop_codon:yes gene_type:complete